MKIPDSPVAQFFIFGVAQFFAFLVIVANTRAYTHGLYFWTAVTDMLFCLQSFLLSKLMIDDKNARTWASGLGTTLGGVAGSLVGIWITKAIYGE